MNRIITGVGVRIGYHMVSSSSLTVLLVSDDDGSGFVDAQLDALMYSSSERVSTLSAHMLDR